MPKDAQIQLYALHLLISVTFLLLLVRELQFGNHCYGPSLAGRSAANTYRTSIDLYGLHQQQSVLAFP
jgi:hypothetical protein